MTPKKLYVDSEYLLKRQEVELVNVSKNKDTIRDTCYILESEHNKQIEELKAENEIVLSALCGMYLQYCKDSGHMFMSAGELAEEVLEQYNLFKSNSMDGKGEFTELGNSLLDKY